MKIAAVVRRLLGRGEDSAEYRCIRCGDEFDRDHHDCPSCDHPYVSEVEE